MTKNNKIILTLLFCNLSTPALAQDVKVITLSGGIAWASPGETQTIYFTNTNLTPDTIFRNRYIAEESTQTMGTGELFFALQKPYPCYFNTQLGFAVGGAYEAKLQGRINVNYAASGSAYEYYAHHARVVFRGKMISNINTFVVQPYITGAIGGAFNKAYGFRTRPLIDPTISPRWFKNNTESFAFTYSLGLGVQKSINNNWNIGLGYEFSDWGKTSLGRGLPQWSKDGPYLSHVYSQSLLFSMSYLY